MGKPQGNPQVQARVPDDLFEWIEERADEERRTKSNFVRKVLAERREAEEQGKRVPA